jgi:hypothetical protein
MNNSLILLVNPRMKPRINQLPSNTIPLATATTLIAFYSASPVPAVPLIHHSWKSRPNLNNDIAERTFNNKLVV